ncbi:hypothetical protein B0J17DRAFT_678299 [Rhizoctonia solani]|nr:hypothetical protein B0J17DRAFT_678299 [Rhizoctonia solani]
MAPGCRRNYGEGNAREHVAPQPLLYGCSMIVTRSFARIHEGGIKGWMCCHCHSPTRHITEKSSRVTR